MLAIRLQRRGRKGHAQYRLIVQDKDLSPKSGRVIHNLGSYDPHKKSIDLDKEKAEFYLSNGAQPSNTAAKILKNEGIKLPKWVEIDTSLEGKLRNPEKLRKNQPDEPAPEAEEAAPTEEAEETDASVEEAEAETADDKAEGSVADKAEDNAAEKPAEEEKEEKAEKADAEKSDGSDDKPADK